MTKNNIDYILKDMASKGEVKRRVGDVTVIRYNPSPLESLLKLDPRNKVKLQPIRLSKKQKAKIKRDWKQIVEYYGPQDASDTYLNLSQGE